MGSQSGGHHNRHTGDNQGTGGQMSGQSDSGKTPPTGQTGNTTTPGSGGAGAAGTSQNGNMADQGDKNDGPGQHRKPPRDNGSDNPPFTGNAGSSMPGDQHHRDMNGQGDGNGDHNFSNDHRRPHDDPARFRHMFEGFGFGYGMFARPYFDVDVGVRVPHSYRLRPVPRQIYRYYPDYRGFLFFVTRDGGIAIVSPRTYRIIDII